MNSLEQLIDKTLEQARKEYSLVEIVGIMNLINNGVKIKDIVKLSGRSVHSLRYKFFEKATLKGKDAPRSVMQYATTEELFKAHNQTYSEELHQQMIEEYNQECAKRLNQ